MPPHKPLDLLLPQARGGRQRRQNQETHRGHLDRPLPQLSLALTMDKDKRPLHLVKSTGPEGTAWEEEHHAAQHRGHGVAFGDGRPLHSFIWPVETEIIPAPKSGC